MIASLLVALSILSAQPASPADVETMIAQMIPADALQVAAEIQSNGAELQEITDAMLDEVETARLDGWCASELMDMSIDLTAFLARYRGTSLSSLSGDEQTLVSRAVLLLQRVENVLANPSSEELH